MSSIVITTPKGRAADAAAEAQDAQQHGGETRYFRRFGFGQVPTCQPGDRVFYVENGFVRGFAIVDETTVERYGRECDTTGNWFDPGIYVWMRADSWQWIKPIPLQGFQEFRYTDSDRVAGHAVEVVGGWRDPMPPTPEPRSRQRETVDRSLYYGPRDVAILGGDPSL